MLLKKRDELSLSGRLSGSGVTSFQKGGVKSVMEEFLEQGHIHWRDPKRVSRFLF